MLTTLLLMALAGQNVEPAAAAPPPADERKICRKEQSTGSRLGGKRICHTKAEWDEIAANSRNDIDSATGRLNTAAGR